MMMSPAAVRKNVRKINSGQHIKVFTRCRPMNTNEKNSKSLNIIECQQKEIIVRERAMDKYTKTFSFDKVFGPDSKQVDVYRAVAKPLVDEVLNGFNCTIFAYGQTGTGKTFTMEGEHSTDDTSWEEDPLSGIIPRCVNHLFDELRIQKLEFTMQVSFLEMYNEELFDLLSAHDDMSKLRMYEDSSRKGSCIIQGLEEVLVRSKADVYNFIEKGSAKRQTAATQMNAHSSRSHTVFTVTVHIKENTLEGDELLKTGKLHLVDLAGSENIGRSGAVDKRAREAGNINQSLLTLGRVITSLVEKAPHIPYRESKLTRLLQDALGGRTKTSIIATVSPASVNLEETLSTLDYAHRAKNIQNKPEVNQKLNKKELIGEYTVEIDRLRRDLMAMREKNGVYLANENYQDMINTMEQQSQEISEKITQIRSLEEDLENKTNLFNSVSTQLDQTCIQLSDTENVLDNTKEALSCTQTLLSTTANQRDEQTFLVSAHAKTEEKLMEEGQKLINVADYTTKDIGKLHDKLDRKRDVELRNDMAVDVFENEYIDQIFTMKETIKGLNEQQNDAIIGLSSQIDKCSKDQATDIEGIISQMSTVSQTTKSLINKVLRVTYESQMNEKNNLGAGFTKQVEETTSSCTAQLSNYNLNQISPAFEMLASLVSTQADLVFKLQDSYTASFKQMVQHCCKCSDQQANVCQTLDNRLSHLNKYQNKNCNDLVNASSKACNLTEECTQKISGGIEKMSGRMCEMEEEISKRITEMENEKERLCEMKNEMNEIQSNAKHLQKMVCAELITLPPMINASLTETQTVTQQVSKAMSSLAEIGTAHSLSSGMDQEKAVNNLDSYVNEMETGVRGLGEQRCTLESLISAQNSEMITTVNELQNLTVSHSHHITKLSQDHSHNYCNKLEESSNEVEKEVTEVNNKLSEISVKLTAELQQHITTGSSISEHRHNVLSATEDQLVQQAGDTHKFFTKDMVKDQPTGNTPVRGVYSYSRLLSATSPHDSLLMKMRTRNAAATKIPLPNFSASEDDSLLGSDLSPSDTLKSRSQSVSSVVDAVSRQPLSRSGSGNDKDHSVFLLPNVPQSQTDNTEGTRSVPVSRSSSTSSLTDLKENDSQNNTVTRKGSFKKREMKQPSNFTNDSRTRSRKVLGNQN